ncbi:hypothetical protein ACN28E_31075 [Archangium lansingense]|uniref:hypothetical protein n=1 Tax=Archangium lansingense TaxID=2995310 RepID=UPI003B7D1310
MPFPAEAPARQQEPEDASEARPRRAPEARAVAAPVPVVEARAQESERKGPPLLRPEPPRAATATAVEPRVQIGRVEVIVSAPQPASAPAGERSPAAGLTSRLYLRNV